MSLAALAFAVALQSPAPVRMSVADLIGRGPAEVASAVGAAGGVGEADAVRIEVTTARRPASGSSGAGLSR